jgi:hypothetical protein
LPDLTASKLLPATGLTLSGMACSVAGNAIEDRWITFVAVLGGGILNHPNKKGEP